jgi:putative peptidoglycan lipid II flippase
MSDLFLHSFLFGFATLISRALGLFRDILFAHYYGISAEYDAYLIAILFPFFLRKIFAEGALSSAFIPLFSRKEGKDAQVFFSTAIWATLICTGIIYLPVLFFSDSVAFILGSGLDKETIYLAGYLMKFTYPFIVFISLWAIVAGVLNNKDSYFIPAFAPSLSNISTIIFTAFSFMFVPQVLGPTIGFVVGGFLQFIFVMFFLKRYGMKITFDFNIKYLKQILVLMGPALLGVAISSLNSLVDTNIATWTGKGGVSTIQYALRIYQLPLGIFGVSVANSLLPKLSNAIKNENNTLFSKYLSESVSLLLFFTIPSALGMIFMGNGLVSLLYEHGSFGYEDTLITAKVLMAYAIGLPFYSLYGIFVKTYHSNLNTKFPTLVSVFMLLINIVLDIVFAIKFGVVGIALATSIAGFFGVIMVGYASIKKMKKSDFIEIFKIFLCGILMVIFILLFDNFVFSKMMVLMQLILAVTVFFISAYLFKVKTLEQALKILKLRRRK